jgi:hypothetical protein
MNLSRHSRESGNPAGVGAAQTLLWIPASAGMTK